MDSQVSTIGTFLLGKWDYIIAYISIMLIFQDCYVKAVVSCFVFFPSSRLHLSSESPTFYRVLLKLHSQRVIVWECSKYNGNEKNNVCLLLYREARVLFIAYSNSLYKFLQNFFFFLSQLPLCVSTQLPTFFPAVPCACFILFLSSINSLQTGALGPLKKSLLVKFAFLPESWTAMVLPLFNRFLYPFLVIKITFNFLLKYNSH